ncbi:peptide ABC transporter permease [Streptomyces sulfonofaciens]|uniref:Peptide ABC transporter permease n=1 Tax=Streptomyces sulfonofaciens TaxID=68272 RepID=A0A919L7Y9_9ACTN|nr:ABC transporter permease [Streptomyces sulfonofaciens]GHH86724.1 peptide ABC transporter permease [Streptomyces sulfonofaciens]
MTPTPPATAALAVGDAPGPGGTARAAQPRRRQVARGLFRSPAFLAGALVLLFWVVDAIFWPFLAPQDPQKVFPEILQGPSAAHLLGTDNLGRDVLSRLLAGASTVLTVAPAATALGLLGGVALGLVTGYYRGLVDDVAMRVVDAFLAFPLVILAVLVLTTLGPSELNVIILIGVTFTPLVARTVRSAVLAQRDLDYVAAARLQGESGPRIMVAEILPNVLGPIIVEGTVRLGYAIFTSATLSFLSLGIQQPSPDWGLTISLGQANLQVAPWIVLFPALALATLVVAVNLVADGLSQAVKA